MKIYHNAQFLSKLKRFVFKKNGDYLNTLIGINLAETELGDMHVYPVYRSIRFVRFPDCFLIELPLGKKGLVILIRKYRIESFILDADTLDLSDVGNQNPSNQKVRKEKS